MSALAPVTNAESFTSLEARRDVLAQAFVPLEATPLGDRAAFHGRVQAASVNDLQLSVVSGPGPVVRRTRRLVQRTAADLYKVGVQLRGRGLVEQDGRVAELSPGDLTVYDTAGPYDFNRKLADVARELTDTGAVPGGNRSRDGSAGPG